MKIRVAFIDQSGDQASGAQESLFLLLRGLPQCVEPIVILFNDGEFSQRLRDSGHTVVCHPVSKQFSSASRYGSPKLSDAMTFLEILRLSSLLFKLKPTIVHTNTVKAHIIGVPAATLCGIPSVMHLRDSLEGRTRHLLSFFGKHLATKVIAVSKRVDQWHSIPKTQVIYNPFRIDEETDVFQSSLRSKFGLPTDIPIIGMVGPIHRNKGQERFIRILGNVLKSTNAFGVIIGDSRFSSDDQTPILKSLAGQLGLNDRLAFLPWIKDVNEAYASLDILCNCSTNEPFGRSVVEASSLGIVCSVFDDCGASEVLVDRVSVAISPAHDEAAFATRVVDLLTDAALRHSLGAEAKKAVKILTVDKHAFEVFGVYRNIAFS